MTKNELISSFIKQLEDDLAAGKEAARASQDAATNEESKPENQYDTRALEASYLAGAQAHRVRQINEVLVQFQVYATKTLQPVTTVQATALVALDADGKKSRVLFMPKGGGVSLQYQGETIQILTPSSTLGEALLGLKAGDVAEYEVNGQLRECSVVSVQ